MAGLNGRHYPHPVPVVAGRAPVVRAYGYVEPAAADVAPERGPGRATMVAAVGAIIAGGILGLVGIVLFGALAPLPSDPPASPIPYRTGAR